MLLPPKYIFTHALMLCRNVYPDRLEYVDQVFQYANKEVGRYANTADLHAPGSQANLLSLLLAPVKTYFSLFTALAIPSFIPLLHAQPYPTRRAVAGEVARSILRNETKISSMENLQGVLEILKVLIKEGMQQPSGYPGGPARRTVSETDETVEEQGWLARTVHLIRAEDANTQFKVNTLHVTGVSVVLIYRCSSFKPLVRHLLKGMSASDTRPQLL